uniref:Uncharacterized protein n=1 Tax=Oryza sativa subsp. japonica TaxID=39947 RepID=Q6YZE6_ORYSJ|nr:hypothetical protein [Oryza sativa Japonica Group]
MGARARGGRRRERRQRPRPRLGRKRLGRAPAGATGQRHGDGDGGGRGDRRMAVGEAGRWSVWTGGVRGRWDRAVRGDGRWVADRRSLHFYGDEPSAQVGQRASSRLSFQVVATAQLVLPSLETMLRRGGLGGWHRGGHWKRWAIATSSLPIPVIPVDCRRPTRLLLRRLRFTALSLSPPFQSPHLPVALAGGSTPLAPPCGGGVWPYRVVSSPISPRAREKKEERF